MNDDVVGALAVLCIFGGPVFGWIVVRSMKHRERIEMIRHGMMVPPNASEQWWRNWEQNAHAAPGPMPQQAPMPPPPPMAAMQPQDYYAAQKQLRKGITVTFIGLAITIGLSMIGGGSFGPQLLGGLIPMFVGLAQIICAVLSGASLTPPGVRFGPLPPPSPPPPPNATFGPQAQPTGFPGSYTYRPDPNIQELQPPLSPPDRR
jgi:hypothetical protein